MKVVNNEGKKAGLNAAEKFITDTTTYLTVEALLTVAGMASQTTLLNGSTAQRWLYGWCDDK